MSDRTNNGRFTEGNRAAALRKGRMADGYDGVVAFGGIVSSGETSSDLVGTKKWRTFANMHELPPVARWSQLRSALFAGITWTAVENEAGGRAARRGQEVVEQGLLKARLKMPWAHIAAEGIHGAAANGFSIHATALGRRKDGLVVYTDIAPRPQHTIEGWFREGDESTPFARVTQRIVNGKTVPIDLDECLYVVNNNGTGSTRPDGVGMLRLIAERVRKLGVYEPLEGSELASSLGGIPVTRAPLQEMKAAIRAKLGKNDPDAVSKIAAAISEKLKPLRDFVAKRFKDPSKLAWFELDSATYEGSDPNTITGIKKWDLEIIKGEMQGLPDIRKIITDLYLDIYRMLGIEHVVMGGDAAGTFGAHESKLDALGATMNAEVGLFAWIATEQLARRQVRANGLDPDVATPTLTPSPILRTDIIKAVQAISQLNLAGLPPNHSARKAVFEGVDLPWEDEEEALMLPRGDEPPPKDSPPADDDDDDDDDDDEEDDPTVEAKDPGEKPTEKP